jgi:hypothetical protein
VTASVDGDHGAAGGERVDERPHGGLRECLDKFVNS